MKVTFSIPKILSQAELDHVVEMINVVYKETEGPLFEEFILRTTVDEIDKIVRAENLILARDENATTIGCVQVRLITPNVMEFGLLVASKTAQKQGLGRLLVAEAERWAIRHGATTSQLRVMIPRGHPHPYGDFLIAWYSKQGYKHAPDVPIYSDLKEENPGWLYTCDFVPYVKSLKRPSHPTETRGS